MRPGPVRHLGHDEPPGGDSEACDVVVVDAPGRRAIGAGTADADPAGRCVVGRSSSASCCAGGTSAARCATFDESFTGVVLAPAARADPCAPCGPTTPTRRSTTCIRHFFGSMGDTLALRVPVGRVRLRSRWSSWRGGCGGGTGSAWRWWCSRACLAVPAALRPRGPHVRAGHPVRHRGRRRRPTGWLREPGLGWRWLMGAGRSWSACSTWPPFLLLAGALMLVPGLRRDRRGLAVAG